MTDAERRSAHYAIVRDLAACDPVLHHLEDYGELDVWTCSLCGAEWNGNSKLAREWSGDPSTFPHTERCPWRRAKELTT